MNEQYPRRPDGPWTAGQYRPAAPDHLNPTERFPTAQYPSAQYPGGQVPGQFPDAQFPAQAYPRPAEPLLAHEGGFPYGMPPAAPYAHPEHYIPQHLHVPPQPFPHGPYPPQYAYPQQMQQTVLVQGNGKRVSHGLHLLLTLITAGLWLPVWIILAIANS